MPHIKMKLREEQRTNLYKTIDVPESAGSQPSTVLDSGEDGGSARMGRAKTGRAAEKGVGGGT